ncbi:hypothetical protein D3C86_2119510 [compost metagenome]
MGQQGKGIGLVADAGIACQQRTLAVLGQQVVEVPLHRPQRAAIGERLPLQRQRRAQGEGVRVAQPLRVIAE